MPKKPKKDNKDKIDDIKLEDLEEEDAEEEDSDEAIEEELDPDIAKALNPNKKKIRNNIEIDYIPETDLVGIGTDETDEEEF